MHLNEGHVFEKVHPYSGHYSGSRPARPSASSAKSVSSRSSSSASVLSYAYAPTGDERYSKVLKMGSKSGSTEGYGGNAAAAANVVVQDVNNDGVSRRSQYRRQRPARISISPTEDKNGTHSQHPTTPNSKALPQLPRLIPPSPLSASFERSLSLSEHTVSEVSFATLAVPASPITNPVTNQILPSAEDFSFRQQRSSLVTIQSGSEESTFSRRPGSISTLAFGNLKSGSGNETYEISLDSDKDSSSNYLRGYEGDYDSASAESSSEGEVDFAKYYERRVSEDLQHVQQTYRASRHRHNFNIEKSKETGTWNQSPRQYRRRTLPMDRTRGTSYYYSSGDEHVRYLEEVEIIDLRAETQVSYTLLLVTIQKTAVQRRSWISRPFYRQ
ncbi:hypothetical protein C8R41DRAFT_854142 [Lentinula lateritia]|uniref:Uncharacterized protein n=1 Tax=Lentinula lateritia TaxID=40482 RepID=A0ABQ8V0X9_9AGAR|nr:hypothetical protein C8R41DRAFT_854142 [Lentinula lateritia]